MNKKKLLSLAVTASLIGTGCTIKKDNDKQDITLFPIKYSEVENYLKYSLDGNQFIKTYKNENVCLFYRKDTYEMKETLFDEAIERDLKDSMQIYDLETGAMLSYYGCRGSYDYQVYSDLMDNYEKICLDQVSYLKNDDEVKEYYTLEEIREIERQIYDRLLLHNKSKSYVKTRW